MSIYQSSHIFQKIFGGVLILHVAFPFFFLTGVFKWDTAPIFQTRLCFFFHPYKFKLSNERYTILFLSYFPLGLGVQMAHQHILHTFHFFGRNFS